MNVELPDGTVLTDIPEGTTRDQLRAKLEANGYDVSKLGGSPMGTAQAATVRPSVGGSVPEQESTADKALEFVKKSPLARSVRAYGKFAGDTLVGLGKGTQDLVNATGLNQRVESPLAPPLTDIPAERTAVLNQMYKEAGPGATLGSLTTELAIPGGVANKAAGAAMGAVKGTGGLAKALRYLAGAATGGGVGGALTVPREGETRGENALQGAAAGLAVAPVAALVGAIPRAIRGPETPARLLTAAREAQEAGYVFPPTQVKQSILNRALEGTSGKIATGQNASAANREVSNRLAKQAIGATDDLSPEVLASIRSKANRAYTELGDFGTIKADDAFAKTVRDAGQRAEGFAKDFPELVNKDTEKLIESFAGKTSFDSKSAIEAIKRLREGQRTIAGNFQASAEAKDFGRTQGKLADAIESLVERNLDDAGRPELLTSFRDARKTLARVYDVEKIMNPASGNVDVRKLKKALERGRLTGELKTAAEFGQSFPKAAQPIEGMGSLPQISPLDVFGTLAVGGLGASQQGPSGAALGALYPAARLLSRKAALSPMVQRSLTKPGISDAEAAEMMARILRQSSSAAGTMANDF